MGSRTSEIRPRTSKSLGESRVNCTKLSFSTKIYICQYNITPIINEIDTPKKKVIIVMCGLLIDNTKTNPRKVDGTLTEEEIIGIFTADQSIKQFAAPLGLVFPYRSRLIREFCVADQNKPTDQKAIKFWLVKLLGFFLIQKALKIMKERVLFSHQQNPKDSQKYVC